MMKKYLKLKDLSILDIIVLFFRILWTASFILKVLMPKTAFSWIRSFLMEIHLVKWIVFETMIPVWFVFLFFISLEFFLSINLSIKSKLTIYVNFYLTVLFLVVTVTAYVFSIPGSCGCFGAIVVWENDIYKVIFNLFLTIGAYYILKTYKNVYCST